MAKILLLGSVFSAMTVLMITWNLKSPWRKQKISSVDEERLSINYTRCINYWDKHKENIVLRGGDHKKAVIVIENTDSKKSTLLSTLSGRKKRSYSPNDYEIAADDDEEEISTSDSSKKLIPELVADVRNDLTYFDYPVVHDNQDIEDEISLSYFQNMLMNQVEQIKLIFVINHESLKIDGNSTDFDDLFEHIGKFIRNISKIHDGVALVVTNVDDLYEPSGDGASTSSSNDQVIFEEIENYLRLKQETYLNKTENSRKNKMFVNLIDVLLQRNGSSYTKIVLLKQPTPRGSLNRLSKREIQINAISNAVTNTLSYVRVKKDDFDFILPESSKNTVDRIIDDAFRNASTNHLQKILNEIHSHFLQIQKECSDIKILQTRTWQAYQVFSQLEGINEPIEFFKKFFHACNTLKIPISSANFNLISDDIKKLYFFTTLSNSNNTCLISLKKKMQGVINSIQDTNNFYSLLQISQDHSDTFEISEHTNKRVAKIKTLLKGSYRPVALSMGNEDDSSETLNGDDSYQSINIPDLNRYQMNHLRAVRNVLTTDFDLLCPSSSEVMTVKGYNVRLSDVVKTDCWNQAKIIQILALNKVFIDCTVNKTGTETQLIIIAPTWEVVGKQKIILDGKEGKPHEKKSAKASSFSSENGANGLPGLPGGSGGNFFGIGRQFEDSENLEIHVNGGRGGPGQNGGNGADGIPGRNFPPEFFDVDRRYGDIEQYLKNFNSNSSITLITSFSTLYGYIIRVPNTPAINPTNGGDGGAGGLGGYPGQVMIKSLRNMVYAKISNHSGLIGPQGQGGFGGKKTLKGRGVVSVLKYDSFLPPHAVYSNIEWLDDLEVPPGNNGNPGSNDDGRKLPTIIPMTNLYSTINSYKEFVRMNLFENVKESELKSFIQEIENDNYTKAQYNTLGFVKEFEGLENQFFELKNKIDFVPIYESFLSRVEEYSEFERNLMNKKVLNHIYTAALTKLFALKRKRKGQTVVDLEKYLNNIELNVKDIRESQHMQVVQMYQGDYKKTLYTKIREAEDFIQKKIEPEINTIWEESDSQMKAIIDEINENKNTTLDAMETLERNKVKIRQMMEVRAALLPLKLAGTALSFFGPIGAGVGVAVTTAVSIADGMLLDTSSLGQKKVYSINPSLKLMSRVKEVFNNKQQLVTEKLNNAITKLGEYEKEFLETSKTNDMQKKRTIRKLKTQLQEAMFRKTTSVSDVLDKQKDIKEIERKIADFANSEKDILEKLNAEKKNVENIAKEKRYETALRRINDVQAVLNGVEIVFNFVNQIQNDQGMIQNINNQLSEYSQQLKGLEMMENQVYDIIGPDFRQIENTINMAKSSMNGSSHAKLDLTKWTVRASLKDVKSLLQKFTHKMSFELQNNLERYVEKIDEGFSILVDIYDRIDAYSDSVKQAEYIAHITTASMTNIPVTDSELSKAMINIKLIIQSNILFEKYNIALHAFKQHFYPFAALMWQKFRLPPNLRLNDTESLRSNIIDRIADMKSYIDNHEAIIGEYSEYIHEKKKFNSYTSGSAPFYRWKYHTIKNEIQQLFNKSEILLKADISKGLFYNSVKFTHIGIYFRFHNKMLQSNFTSVIKNYKLIMKMIGNNYYRCGERYHFISFDDSITLSYTLDQDQYGYWIDPNKVYTKIYNSSPFISPYTMWKIKLISDDESLPSNYLNVYANEKMDIELTGQGYYIEQNADFNFEVCNERMNTFYDTENIVKELVLDI